ncbi:DnaA N-terminal domain-containing protein [Metabacillus halosaccharovorans]|uniref:DnaA N-terminal domain-containing protein n=3 Tax=Metabacillus halosaccharovorans TaxID=930124 RepID=UPI00203C8D1D|nr:DnaA N-terminal domain-containing protein [Metabacillus halosaccharovorans]MCM3441409.1 helix-turn-helix domain-containing protein [Metabacillus halosaccharovorans]
MEDPKRKNLKGTYSNLAYYRNVETGRTFPRQRVKKGKNSEADIEVYYVPELEKRVFSEKEVKEFSLDKYGRHIPYVDGELTILNNYLFDYWGYYLKAEGLALYAHLKRYAYGQKDWCFPSLELISQKMDKSLNTVRNFLDILERYGFIYKFNVINNDRDQLEESPIYKIRKKIPLLTDKLLNGDPTIIIDEESTDPHIKQALKKEQKGLPKALKKDHDEYVKNMLSQSEEVNLMEYLSYEEIYSELLKRSKVIKNESQQKEMIKSQTIIQQPKLPKNLTEQDILVWESVKNNIKDKISKPSFETWFKSTYCIREENTYHIYSANEFQKDWLQTRYHQLIKENIENIDYHCKDIQYFTYNNG